MQDYNHSRHAVYMLTYHMIFVTKWRKPAISEEVGDFMKDTARHLCETYGGELISAETDRDHIHLLISLPPQACVSTIVRNMKTQLSRQVHEHPKYGAYVKRFLHGDAPLWSASYFAATTGSVSMETVKRYIDSQRSEAHHHKYKKGSPT